MNIQLLTRLLIFFFLSKTCSGTPYFTTPEYITIEHEGIDIDRFNTNSIRPYSWTLVSNKNMVNFLQACHKNHTDEALHILESHSYDSIKIIQLLLALFSMTKATPLHLATTNNNYLLTKRIKKFQQMILEKTNKNIFCLKDFYGMTPLDTTATCGKTPLLQLLFSCKENRNSLYQTNHNTPLHFAIVVNNLKSIEYFLKQRDPKKGQTLNARTSKGLSPLELALANYHYKAALMLIQAGSNTQNIHYEKLIAEHGHKERFFELADFLLMYCFKTPDNQQYIDMVHKKMNSHIQRQRKLIRKHENQFKKFSLYKQQATPSVAKKITEPFPDKELCPNLTCDIDEQIDIFANMLSALY